MSNDEQTAEAADDSGSSELGGLPITLADAANFIKSGKSFDIAAAGLAVAHGVPIPPSIVARIRIGAERIIDASFHAGTRMIERRTERADFDAKLQREIINKAARQGVKNLSAESADRIVMSYLNEHQRKYANKSAVVAEAFTSLADDTPTIDENPDSELSDDWLNLFADVAAQKSSHEMQHLMGRILAGEIRQPGCFSPLTIHALSTLTQPIAKKFERLCEAAIKMDNEVIVPALVTADIAARGIPDLDIQYVDMLHLRSYGLLASETLSSYEFKPNATSHLMYGRKRFTARLRADVTSPAVLQGVIFSQVGRELYGLVAPAEAPGFDKWFKDAFTKQGVSIEPV
ncbi:DUF2806 domain-containing protein [Paraburkholderia phytofirmans]|uniref:DUF2806 domain-containing protein n=1 Tax=Paraburkholderia phytofirmans TaxID=261302 RepID=UPI0038B74D20